MSAVHYYTERGMPVLACGEYLALAADHHTTEPGQVTCFACRKTEAFKRTQTRTDVRTPVPVTQLLAAIREVLDEYDRGIHPPTDALSIIRGYTNRERRQ